MHGTLGRGSTISSSTNGRFAKGQEKDVGNRRAAARRSGTAGGSSGLGTGRRSVRRGAEGIGFTGQASGSWARRTFWAEVVEPLPARKVVVQVHGGARIQGRAKVGSGSGRVDDASAGVAVNSEFLQGTGEGVAV